jgi:hypothetical protein
MLRRMVLKIEALTEIRKIKSQRNLDTKAPDKTTILLARNLKPVKRNLHLATLTSSAPSMNSTASRDANPASKVPPQPFGDNPRILIEEIATAIAEAQAALFAGRIQDLETSIIQQRELCTALKTLQNIKSSFENSDPRELVAVAQRARQQNLTFAAVVRRMRGHLDTLRNLLNGLSLSYQPKPVKVPGRES